MPYVMVLILTALSTIGWSLPSHAESEFKGFYGQVATGYEDNRFSSINRTGKISPPFQPIGLAPNSSPTSIHQAIRSC